jgi:Protein of unknown function (DUF2573)
VEAWEQLISKYADLLIGDDSPEALADVQKWALYSHIQRTMPALTSHWISEFPEQKAHMRDLFTSIKARNEAYRNANKQQHEAAQETQSATES